jgi:hypothetical protein
MKPQSFAVARSSYNSNALDFKRRLIDSPPRTRPGPVIIPLRSEILEPPNLSATLSRQTGRIPKQSRGYTPNSHVRESSWNARFNVSFSKDNTRYPRALREYFDRPLDFTEGKDLSSTLGFASTPVKIRASTSHSRRSKRGNSMSKGWVLREDTQDLKWRTVSPVTAQLNQHAHPWMRKYFDMSRGRSR